MDLQYPLNLSFKKTLRGQEVSLFDASNKPVFYARQKMSANVDVSIYADKKQAEKLYTVKSSRIIDFGGQYRFSDIYDSNYISIKQNVKPPWDAYYQVFDAQRPIISIHATNRCIKLGDTIFEYAPVINLLPGFIFRPIYNVKSESDGKIILKMQKKPSFYKQSFVIENVSQIQEPVQTVALLSLLLITFLGKIRWSISA